MIVLPNAHAPALDPDKAGEMVRNGDLVVDAPLCQRCGVKATFDNPVGVSFRKPWAGDMRFAHRQLDALCARCREVLAR